MKERYTFFVEINPQLFNIAIFNNVLNDVVSIEYFELDQIQERRNIEIDKQEIFKHFIVAINNIESRLNYKINDIILIQNNQVNTYNLRFKMDFTSMKKIKSKDFDKLFKDVLVYFNENIIQRNEEIIINEIIPIQYYRDSEKITRKSEGYGKSLIGDFLFLYSSRSIVHNAINIFEGIKLTVHNFLFTPISFCLLNLEYPKTLYIDFDKYSISYCIFDDAKNLFHYNTLKIGEFEIINDIKKIFKIELEEASEIWNSINNFMQKSDDHIINIKSGSLNIVIQVEKILQIVAARINEIFDLVIKDLLSKSIIISDIYIKNKMNANILLKNLCENAFKIKTKTHNIHKLLSVEKIPEGRCVEDLEKILLSVESYKKFNHISYENAKSLNKLELGKISCFLKNIFY